MIHKENVIGFIDSDHLKTEFYGKIVHRPEIGLKFVKNENAAVIISPLNISFQREIVEQIHFYGYDDIMIFTLMSVKIALELLKFEDSKNNSDYTLLLDRELALQKRLVNNMECRLRFMEHLFNASLSKNVVFVYQSKKVASRTIAESVIESGVYGFHTHKLTNRGIGRGDIKEFIQQKQGRVISLVRDPVARQISLMWHYLGENYKEYVKRFGSLEDIENHFFTIPAVEDEFEWYISEMNSVLGINVYEYPFDRNRGYSIIEKEGITLLLIKVEQLFSLEKVIADFLQNDQFRINRKNSTGKKSWGYTYKNYLENVEIPLEFLKFYYEGNQYMNHFYTEEEIQIFYKYWSNLENRGNRIL